VTPTPPPVLQAPRARRISAPQAPLSSNDDGGRIGTRTKFALAGVVLTAFSCGMMFMVAVDRFWPRARPVCEAVAPESASAAYPGTPGAELAREPARKPAQTTEAQATSPAVLAIPAVAMRTTTKAAAASPPPVEPMPAARPLPVAKLAPAPAPRLVHAPVPAPRVPIAAAASVARGRATVTARKRPAAGSPSAPVTDSASPTEGWNDPFAQ
jgi:hypothetical protein